MSKYANEFINNMTAEIRPRKHGKNTETFAVLKDEIERLRRQVAVLEHDRRGLMDALIEAIGEDANRIMNNIRASTPKDIGQPDDWTGAGELKAQYEAEEDSSETT